MKKVLVSMMLVLGILAAVALRGEKAFCLNCLFSGTCYTDPICGAWCFCYRPNHAPSGKCMEK